jgi:L-alanine-DL-glutamate epimerase-like enolase superfamily enzyme
VSLTEPAVSPGLGIPAATGAVRITAVEAIPFAVPYRRPARFASGQVDTAENVLVRVHTDAGVVGSAEAQPRPYTYGETQASIVSLVRDVLAPRVVGLDPFAVELIHARCATIAGNQVARASIDLAAWDAVGRLLGVPCSRLLGGFAADVPAAHMLSFDEPARMADEALAVHAELGVTTFKVKVGRAPDVDVAAVRAVRAALPAAALYVDANRGWSLPDAQRAGDALVELGVSAIEEPIAVEDHAGRRRLAERWSVPLVGDESAISLDHVERAIDGGEVRAISLKTARTGFTESRRILGLCLGRGVPIHVGSQYEGRLGALASVAFAAAHAETAVRPAEVTNFLDLSGDLLEGLPVVRDGRVAVPTAPGLGADVDEDALHRYREDR